MKKRNISNKSLILGICLLCVLLFFIYSYCIEPNMLYISKITLKFERLSAHLNGMTILHISDLHLTKIGKREERLIEIVNRLNADIFVITGDFVNKREMVDECIQLINKFRTRYGKWGVWGNYDYWRLTPTDRKRLAESDIVMLTNENQSITVNQQNIWIIGVDDPFTGRDDLSQATGGVAESENDFKILLAHSPAIIDEANRYGIDLVLAGHTHGGQIYIPLITHLIAHLLGGGGYISGQYQVGQTYLYVSRGIGTSILPLRAFCPPEIALIKLEKKR